MAWKAVVTNVGKALLASYAEGGHDLLVGRATVAAGTMDEIDMRVAEALTDEKCNASIVNKTSDSNNTRFKVQVGPASAAVGAYTAHQIGLWATLDSGLMTLLALAQDSDGGVGVPLASVNPRFMFALYITIAVENTGNIIVNIDEEIFVTNGTLQEGLAEKVDKSSIVNNLTTETEGKVLDARQGKALNDALSRKANSEDVYTRTQIDAALGAICEALGEKANSEDVYSKSEADELLDNKADAENTYTKDEVDLAVGARAERKVFGITIPATGWTQAGGLYSVSVAVPGMLATDSCGGAGPVQTGTEATDKEIRRAWSKVVRLTAGNDSITVYATGIPAVEVPLQIEVFR